MEVLVMNRVMPLAALLAALVAGTAWAGDGQSEVTQIGRLNVDRLTITGSDNWVSLYQDMPPDAVDGNVALIRINGNGNGGPAGAGNLFAGLGIGEPLVPGQISQTGSGNRLALAVTGNDNIFALGQSGAGNSLTGVIRGVGNEVAALQSGTGNTLSFAQTGVGNMLSVTQISR
jgi:hypothetical protein